MAPGAHFLMSWLGTVNFLKHRRERTLATIAGITPDLDGAGIIIDKITGYTSYYIEYHHYLGHSVFSALAIATIASIFSKAQRISVWIISFILVNVHVVCDLLGSKSPDGYQWPIYYFYPADKLFSLQWAYQWELNAWQNQLIMVILFACCIFVAIKRKVTFFEVFGSRFDNAVFSMYKKYIQRNS